MKVCKSLQLVSNQRVETFTLKRWKANSKILIRIKFRQFFIDWSLISRVKFYSSSNNSQMSKVSEQEQ